mmetsp:Transcript_125240/g.297233  ORF Transcript_125240/g.297233 Transcript_125240/m.297233 type:complete len:234 (-) Transcript_125240:27-728(-)
MRNAQTMKPRHCLKEGTKHLGCLRFPGRSRLTEAASELEDIAARGPLHDQERRVTGITINAVTWQHSFDAVWAGLSQLHGQKHLGPRILSTECVRLPESTGAVMKICPSKALCDDFLRQCMIHVNFDLGVETFARRSNQMVQRKTRRIDQWNALPAKALEVCAPVRFQHTARQRSGRFEICRAGAGYFQSSLSKIAEFFTNAVLDAQLPWLHEPRQARCVPGARPTRELVGVL